MNNIRHVFHVELANLSNLVGILRSGTPFTPSQPENESSPLNEFPGGFQQESTSSTSMATSQPLTMFDKIVQHVVAVFLVILLVPVYILYRISVLIIFFIVAIINRLQSPYTRLNSSDPKDISRKFIIDFDERLQKSIVNNDVERQIQLNRPKFLECSYSEAITKVKKDLKWLIIYIESPHSIESSKFSQTVLTNENLLNFINEKDIQVWGGDITKSESFQVANQFNITKLPFLGLLCLTRQQIPTSSGVQDSQPMISLVVKIQGMKDPDYVNKKLLRAYKKYNPVVNSIRVENGIFPQSFNQPRAQDINQDMYNEWLKWRLSMLPSVECESPARIAVKFPDGSRKEMILPKDSSVDDIYAFIECKMYNNIDLIPGGIYNEPIGFTHNYYFKLKTSFPNSEILETNDNRLVRDIPGIYPNGTLMIQNSH